MSVRIITDSTSDITPKEAYELGISIAPMKVIFGETEYRDNIDITNEEFYAKLATSKNLPTTTQPAVDDFISLYESAPENEIVVITISSKLSGTIQSAAIAAESVEGKKIYIVDSETAALSLNILVRRAIQLRDQGLSGLEIAVKLDEEKKDIVLLAVVDTLTYLQKGGRISKTTAVAGGLLGIKPILTIRDGVIEVIGKERGGAKAYRFIHDTGLGIGTPDFSRPCALGYTADSSNMEKLRETLDKTFCPEDMPIDSIGPTIGTHAGPGAAAITYFKKK